MRDQPPWQNALLFVPVILLAAGGASTRLLPEAGLAPVVAAAVCALLIGAPLAVSRHKEQPKSVSYLPLLVGTTAALISAHPLSFLAWAMVAVPSRLVPLLCLVLLAFSPTLLWFDLSSFGELLTPLWSWQSISQGAQIGLLCTGVATGIWQQSRPLPGHGRAPFSTLGVVLLSVSFACLSAAMVYHKTDGLSSLSALNTYLIAGLSVLAPASLNLKHKWPIAVVGALTTAAFSQVPEAASLWMVGVVPLVCAYHLLRTTLNPLSILAALIFVVPLLEVQGPTTLLAAVVIATVTTAYFWWAATVGLLEQSRATS